MPDEEGRSMTLCIVWRTERSIRYASDSRLSFGSTYVDAGIKIARVPYNVYSVGGPGEPDPLLVSGDLGMAFAGSSVVALMAKEALAEILLNVQGVPGHHSGSMDEIAALIRAGFEVIAKKISYALLENARTCIVFAGYCVARQTLRAFRLELTSLNAVTLIEVLTKPGEIEIFGSGEQAARARLPTSPGLRAVMDALQSIIEDASVTDVGGNIQFGEFKDRQFQPMGVAVLGNSQAGVHYWRGPIDLNADEFNSAQGPLPRFPLLDRIS
ncbi:hypothetical protein NDN16_17645 [Aureimonas altamirensis]|uniref:hypothetical protein n=1 Tax=Aureimonas altamirensis TaxID=370622 RepID=UPI00203707BA|nr:hypothetical protein [Aureimonas altamirensis]MCM2505494.1 hypothetical protein [Aureimonas altamirensis]